MAKLGDSIGLECPACAAPLVLPLTQTGADLTSITLSIDLGALRRHIATQHPQENTMSAFTDKIDSFFSRFVETSHEDLVKVEQAVEEKVQPLLTEVLDTAKADIARLEEQLKALEAKVEQLLNTPDPAPAPAPTEPPAAS